MPDFPLCLGIETSCDETALALVQGGKLLGSVVSSQIALHAIFGGVVPELASREHQRFIGPLLDHLLNQSKLSLTDIDLIAVTRGPGLLGSLLVGMAFAKALALSLRIPLIGVNHLHAHLLAAGLEQDLTFPSLGLVVSGGHTEIYRMESPAVFNRLGRSLDDAAGEILDKVGQFLGLPYPAGRIIDQLAAQASLPLGKLPRPYLANDNLDFSFSGLKTAAINLAAELGLPKAKENLAGFCLSLNLALAETLAAKMRRAMTMYPQIKDIYLAGGVAANTIIRKHLGNSLAPARVTCPAPSLCGDNAAMIAHMGSLLGSQGFYHDLDIQAIPRGRKIPEDMRNFML